MIVLGFLGCGLLVGGCGGSSDAPQTSSSSGSSDEPAVAAMSDPAMADPAMADPAMASAGMSSSMPGLETDPAITESSTDPSLSTIPDPAAEIGDTASSTGTDPALTAGSFESTSSGVDPATLSSTGSTSNISAPGLTTSDPTTDPALLAPGTTTPAFGSTIPGSTPSPDSTDASAISTPTTSGDPAATGAAEAATPGDPVLGGGAEAGGGAKAQEPPADSPDYPAFKVVMGLMQGKYDDLDKLVDSKGRGLIEKIRSGSLSPTEKDDLKKTFKEPQLAGQPRTVGGSRTVTLRGNGQLITIVSKKQGANWKVSGITIREDKKR